MNIIFLKTTSKIFLNFLKVVPVFGTNIYAVSIHLYSLQALFVFVI